MKEIKENGKIVKDSRHSQINLGNQARQLREDRDFDRKTFLLPHPRKAVRLQETPCQPTPRWVRSDRPIGRLVCVYRITTPEMRSECIEFANLGSSWLITARPRSSPKTL